MDANLLDEFAAECGMGRPFRVEVGLKGEPTSQVHEFRQPFLIVGRKADSDLLLDHWLVSRRHAYLQLIEGRFFCVDLGSRTGTHGGDATERAGWVDPVRALQIGPYSVRAEPPDFDPHAADDLPIVTWTIPNLAGGSLQWTMNRGLALVGKSPACKIRLTEPEVSRFHCGLVLTPGGVWAVDLLSQRPIRVNGRAVRFARIEPGDALQVGASTLIADYSVRPGWARPAPADEGSSFDQLPALRPTVLVPPTLWAPAGAPAASAGVDGGLAVGVDPTVSHLVQQFGAMQQQMFDQFHQTMMMMFEGFATLHRESAASIRADFDEVRKLSDEIDSLRAETAKLAEATTLSFQAPAFLRADQAAGALGGDAAGPSGPAPAAARPRAAPPLPDPQVDIHAQLCERLNSIAAERQSRWQKILGMMAKA